jgi:RimJ/RimL family protein N-acetyltransferase
MASIGPSGGSTQILPTTPRLVIRNFEATDFEAVHAYASDPIVTRYTSFGPNSEEETHAFLDRARAAAATTPRLDYTLAVVERESETLIGSIGLVSSDATGQQYSFGYCFNRAYWGRGLGKEAATAVVVFGFDVLGAHRLWAYVFAGNEPSARILRRLGFRQEGLARQAVFARGAWHDVLNFARLRSNSIG